MEIKEMVRLSELSCYTIINEHRQLIRSLGSLDIGPGVAKAVRGLRITESVCHLQSEDAIRSHSNVKTPGELDEHQIGRIGRVKCFNLRRRSQRVAYSLRILGSLG